MPRKRKVSSIDDKCRICLTDHGSMSNIFSETIQLRIKDLSKCTTIVIEDKEDFPRNICHICLYKLDMWSEFKEQFIRSNETLLAYLSLGESPDVEISIKRKHHDSQPSADESSHERVEKKKTKPEIPPLIPLDFGSMDCITDQSTLKDEYSPRDNPSTVSSRDNSRQADEDDEDADMAKEQSKSSLLPTKVKYISGRRNRTNERRKASTKRWVARKKALLAAIGEHASDTDSIVSDETQLSPVQKARAKTNADKEAERQMRLARALKNLETDMTGKYKIKHDSDSIILVDTDSEARRTRSHKTIDYDESRIGSKNSVPPMEKIIKISDADANEIIEINTNQLNLQVSADNEISNLPQALGSLSGELAKKDDPSSLIDKFNPHSVRSELEVEDASYRITSTLVLSEPHYLNKANLSKSINGNALAVDNSEERNTDIIDAVQLRRISPKLPIENDKRFIERCLNIEVEGTEFEALQRVQSELASFVEKDMKQKLLNKDNVDSAERVKIEKSKPKDSFQTLDQQLKTIVEKAIKQNIETIKLKQTPSSSSSSSILHPNSKLKNLSPAFIKAAMRSSLFQPKVLLARLDLNEMRERYHINNTAILEPKDRTEPTNSSLGKRQRVPPVRFGDLTQLTLDHSEYESLIEQKITSTPKASRFKNLKTYGPASAKQARVAVVKNIAEAQRNVPVVRTEKTACETAECDTTTKSLPVPKKFLRVNDIKEGVSKELPVKVKSKKHICGVCRQSFNTRKDVEIHIKTHKNETAVSKQNKHRMMRCKRCHEIVEARSVKSHVCRSLKTTFKCYVCNSTFRTEKLLVRHLETHDESEFNIDNIKKGVIKKSANVSSTQNNIGTSINVTKENTKVGNKPAQTYTCFVCDKIFTDEEVLKDHLQKHCDDISEDEQSVGKEQYQCAICGDTLESEDALEIHLEKHLFDDKDDNPNLISIGTENEKPANMVYKCSECSEEFSSEISLVMHVQAHEEEVAIAEWEKQGMSSNLEFICGICDEEFRTEVELSQHLDVHNSDAHVCLLCDRPFLTLEDLQNHVATH